jgi:predicted HNH restriction endonuclease
MKKCNKCGVIYPLTEYSHNRNTCKKCKRETNKQWYKKNTAYQKKKVKARNKKYANEMRNWFKEYKSTLKCLLCSEDCSACLEFHHKDENKEFNIGYTASGGRVSFNKLKAEIEKCVVLCSNCHKKVHAGIKSIDMAQ